MKAYIGYDPVEDAAYNVAAYSLLKTSGVVATPLKMPDLMAQGLLTRTADYRGGQGHDFISEASVSTRFSISRFLTPILAQDGYALFADCDMVFYTDVNKLLETVDPSKAVSVVKHNHVPREATKMLGKEQTAYHRKNWSSVILFNCNHPSNRRLSLWDVNHRTGRELHGFYWLDDSEIGEIAPEWNWLIGVQPKPDQVHIAHFTLGGPWFDGWVKAEHDEMWLNAEADFKKASKQT